jgi:hypothetical protein
MANKYRLGKYDESSLTIELDYYSEGDDTAYITLDYEYEFNNNDLSAEPGAEDAYNHFCTIIKDAMFPDSILDEDTAANCQNIKGCEETYSKACEVCKPYIVNLWKKANREEK